MIDIYPIKYNKGPIALIPSRHFNEFSICTPSNISTISIPSRKGVGSLTAYQEAEIFDEKYFTNWDGRSRMHAHYFHNLLGLSYLVH